jgi:hypothetical protein
MITTGENESVRRYVWNDSDSMSMGPGTSLYGPPWGEYRPGGVTSPIVRLISLSAGGVTSPIVRLISLSA